MTFRAYLIPAKGRPLLLPPGRFAEREFRRGIARAQMLQDVGSTVEVVVVRYPDHIAVRQELVRKAVQ
jgi:hypothetical protein